MSRTKNALLFALVFAAQVGSGFSHAQAGVERASLHKPLVAAALALCLGACASVPGSHRTDTRETSVAKPAETNFVKFVESHNSGREIHLNVRDAWGDHAYMTISAIDPFGNFTVLAKTLQDDGFSADWQNAVGTTAKVIVNAKSLRATAFGYTSNRAGTDITATVRVPFAMVETNGKTTFTVNDQRYTLSAIEK